MQSKASCARFGEPKIKRTSNRALLPASQTRLTTYLPNHVSHSHKPDLTTTRESRRYVPSKNHDPNASRSLTARVPISTLEQAQKKDWFPNVTPLGVARRGKRHTRKEGNHVHHVNERPKQGRSMPHSFGTHHVVEHEDQGLHRPQRGTRMEGGRGWRWMQLHVQEAVWSDPRGWMQRKQVHPWKRRTCWRG